MMKKVLFFFLSICLLWSCTSPDEPAPMNSDDSSDQTDDGDTGDNTVDEIPLFTLEVIGQSIPENASLDLYAANEEGEIVGEATALNDQITELSGRIEPGAYFTVTFVYKNFYSDGSIKMSTFIEPPTETYVLRADSGNNDICEYEEVELIFRNSGHPVYILAPPYIGSDSSGAEDGGHFTISPSICDSGEFYAVFQSASEGERRFFYSDQLVPGQSFEFDFSSLSVPENTVNTNFPYEIRGGIINTFGIKEGFSHLLHDFYLDILPFGHGQYHDYDLYYPNQFFDRFETNVGVYVGQGYYSMVRVGDPVAGNFNLPSFFYSIENSEMSNFQMNTTGTYDSYGVSFAFIYGGLKRYFSVYGPFNEQVNLDVEGLVQNIFDRYPELEGLTAFYDHANLMNASYVNNYFEIVQFFIDRGELTLPDVYESDIVSRIDF